MKNRHELIMELLDNTNKQLKELEDKRIKNLIDKNTYKKLYKQIIKSYKTTKKQINKTHPIEEYINQIQKEQKGE